MFVLKRESTHGFGGDEDGEDGSLGGEVPEEQTAQLHGEQGGLGARQGLHHHLHTCSKHASDTSDV